MQKHRGVLMSMKPAFKSEKGFTIQELLVALVVGSLLISFCLSLFFFSNRVFVSWQRRCERKDAVHCALQTFALDIRNSMEVTNVNDTSLIVQRSRLSSVSYFFDDATLRRDGVLLFQGSVSVIPILMASSKRGAGKNFVQAVLITLRTTAGGIRYEASTEVEVPHSARQNLDDMKF